MAIAFPSIEFFEALRQQMDAAHDRFKQLGYFDTTFGVRVRDAGLPQGRSDFVLSFEVFDCTGARTSPDVTREEVDFTLDGELEAWVDMLRNIKQKGAADVAHSINTLTHFGEGMRVVYDDPDGHDKLYRFAESIQEFFDLSSKLDLELPAAAAAVRAGA